MPWNHLNTYTLRGPTPFFSFFFKKKLLFCIGVQPINSVWTAEWLSCTYTGMHSPPNTFPSRLPHNIEQSSLSYTLGPCWLSIWRTSVCACPCQTPQLSPTPFWFSKRGYKDFAFPASFQVVLLMLLDRPRDHHTVETVGWHNHFIFTLQNICYRWVLCMPQFLSFSHQYFLFDLPEVNNCPFPIWFSLYVPIINLYPNSLSMM